MRFKTSNQLLIIGLVIFLGAVFLNTILLKKEFQRIDLNDPMRNFEKIALESFNRAYLETGKPAEGDRPVVSMNVEIRQGEKTALYIAKGLKDSLQWSIKDGALQLKGYSSRHKSRQRAMLVLECPALSFLETQAGELKVVGFQADSFILRCMAGSQVALNKVNFQKASFEVAGNSSLSVENGSEVQHLNIGVKDGSSINLDDLLPVSFTKMLDPGASVSLKGKALALFK